MLGMLITDYPTAQDWINGDYHQNSYRIDDFLATCAEDTVLCRIAQLNKILHSDWFTKRGFKRGITS